MATNTYVALDKITVSGTSTASVTFTSISQEYTDLVLVVSGSLYGGANRTSFVVQVGNGSIDTGTNYSSTWVAGNGTTAVSSRYSNGTNFLTGHISEAVGTTIVNFMNYANTSTYKTFIARGNSMGQVGSFDVGGFASLWRSTSAINTIKIYPNDGSFYNSGSTFSLYGIRAEGVSPAAKATGGAIYSDDTYYYHVFGSTGTFTPLQSLTVDSLMVAGGGSSIQRFGGGGGAGGVLLTSGQSVTATGYTVTVGAGGNAGSGTASTFNSLSATGGGNGGGTNAFSGLPGNGGSGGGGTGGSLSTPVVSGGTGVSGQGFAGGNGGWYRCGGGGGGAGAVGEAAFPATSGGSSAYGGNGGVGTATYQTWLSATGAGQNVSGTYYIAGGGGGGANLGNAGDPGTWGSHGLGGYGGGGNGGAGNTGGGSANLQTATNGLANTGGGGGGMEQASAQTLGGSGIVIIRYLKV